MCQELPPRTGLSMYNVERQVLGRVHEGVSIHVAKLMEHCSLLAMTACFLIDCQCPRCSVHVRVSADSMHHEAYSSVQSIQC